MKKQIEIVVPNNWNAVTLKEYLDLQKDLKSYEDNEEAITAILFHRLCKIKVEWISKLDVETYVQIRDQLASFLSQTELPLQKFITIDGVEYGFEPNLSNMSYGAYVDITKYKDLTIDDKWAEIMSILYRPVTRKAGQSYMIADYDGNINPNPFLSVGMDVHFGALFFLVNLYKDLLKGTLNYMMETVQLPPSIKSILEKSGVLTQQ